jgi:hypothetical protein
MSSGAKSEKLERERRLAAELAAKLVGGLAGSNLWGRLRAAGCTHAGVACQWMPATVQMSPDLPNLCR